MCNMAVTRVSRRHSCATISSLICYRALCLLVVFLVQFKSGDAWDDTDLELFDLVEEISENFYEVLGLDQSATQGDIRRAYRRLTLQYHPDKNKEDGAEEAFRKLVSVAEVLRDEEKRKRYDDILINGLPDWRQPVYYYRRVRKMGLLEATTLLSIFLTVGHYIVMWSMYWEKKFELESLIKPKKEKRNKKTSKLSPEEQAPDAYAILEDQSFLPKPLISDSLPFKCYRLSKASVLLLAATVGDVLGTVKEKLTAKREDESASSGESGEEGEEGEEEGGCRPRVRQKTNPALYEYDRDVPLDHLEALRVVPGEPAAGRPEEGTARRESKNDIWTQEDVKLLIKSIAKYPGGTVDRWDRIAGEVGRPVTVVTRKAKEIKTKGYATAVDAGIQGITGGVTHAVVSKVTGEGDSDCISIASTPPGDRPITCEVASYDYFEEEHMDKKRKRNKARNKNDGRTAEARVNARDGSDVEGSSTDEQARSEGVADGVESCGWTQRQQKVLEKALQVYPKGTPERWERIASSVPGKSKEECITRYKELVEVIRRKKRAAEK